MSQKQMNLCEFEVSQVKQRKWRLLIRFQAART